MIVIGALVLVALVFLLVRDPVAAAAFVRGGWDLGTNTVATVVASLSTFFQHLFR